MKQQSSKTYEQNEIITKTVKKKKRFPAFLFLCGVIIVFLLSVKMHNDVSTNELTAENSSIKKEISILDNEKTRLLVEIESKTNLKNVEIRAQEELGLYKIEKYQIHYFSMPNENKVINLEEEKNPVLEAITRTFSTILEFLN